MSPVYKNPPFIAPSFLSSSFFFLLQPTIFCLAGSLVQCNARLLCTRHGIKAWHQTVWPKLGSPSLDCQPLCCLLVSIHDGLSGLHEPKTSLQFTRLISFLVVALAISSWEQPELHALTDKMALRSKLPNLLENVARCMALSPQDTVDEEDDFVNLHESSYATVDLSHQPLLMMIRVTF